jgi:hypothetical protein
VHLSAHGFGSLSLSLSICNHASKPIPGLVNTHDTCEWGRGFGRVAEGLPIPYPQPAQVYPTNAIAYLHQPKQIVSKVFTLNDKVFTLNNKVFTLNKLQ